METPLVVGDRRFPSGNPQGRALPHLPSGNPNGIMTVGMDVDQFLHPETPPEDGPSPFPLPEFEGRALPHPPPGILKGFCHKAQGCAAEALPWVHAQHINNPEGGCAERPNGGHVGCLGVVCILAIPSGRTLHLHQRTPSHSALFSRTPRRARTAQPLAG